ncbi:tripartite tricarboxylate transporter TctB family protein [Blastococcus mobilis]|uniref:Tripartite tricarboxylate transporter TctB family protein n=1 Tax=Blastococcus mobilis TaxID=1938746 RepID=A0A238UP78_9ACTN|nr:tripartite tricarboxylate transporter TctB family protein [Blastococcus mobilis]SNR23774.1 Tripartite tricarboxylate transporter TctB family protein [Blastococcus mobilis]
MTSPHDGAHTPGSPGGRTAAGATSQGDVEPTSAGPAHPAEPAPSTLHDLEEAVHQLEAEAEHRPPPAGLGTNLVVAAVVVILGAAALLGSMSLGAGSAGNPGPGTWPMIISVVLVVLGIGLVVTARSTSDAERFSGSTWLVLAGLATMVVFVALISVIGFEIPAALLAFVWLRFLGRESWRSSIVTSLCVVVAFYVVFVAALSVPIPHLF